MYTESVMGPNPIKIFYYFLIVNNLGKGKTIGYLLGRRGSIKSNDGGFISWHVLICFYKSHPPIKVLLIITLFLVDNL